MMQKKISRGLFLTAAVLIYLGAFVLYFVAGKMIVHEPFIDNHLDPLHDFIENVLP